MLKQEDRNCEISRITCFYIIRRHCTCWKFPRSSAEVVHKQSLEPIWTCIVTNDIYIYMLLAVTTAKTIRMIEDIFNKNFYCVSNKWFFITCGLCVLNVCSLFAVFPKTFKNRFVKFFFMIGLTCGFTKSFSFQL